MSNFVVINGKLYIKATEPVKSAEAKPEPADDVKIVTIEEELKHEINSACDLPRDELIALNDKVYNYYMEKTMLNKDNEQYCTDSAINLDCKYYKQYNHLSLSTLDKYSLIANYFQHVLNDTISAKRFYLLAIKHGSNAAMYNYSRIFYMNSNFEKAKILFVMAICRDNKFAMDKLKIMFKNNNKSAKEYLDTLKTCVIGSLFLIKEIERVENIINKQPDNNEY